MALMSEFQEERRAVWENGTLKQKALYIWDYYKWYIIVPIIVVSVIIWYIVHLLTATDTLFQGVFLNAYSLETDTITTELLHDYYELQGIDTKEEEINLNTSLYYTAGNDNANYETLQVLMAWSAAKQLDFIAGDSASINELAYKGYLVDLREVLSEEQLAKYEPYFLYIHQSVQTRRALALQEDEDISSITYPDCTKPEDMEEPVPVMIDMSQSDILSKLYSDTDDAIAVGITVSCEKTELVLEFLEYLGE